MTTHPSNAIEMRDTSLVFGDDVGVFDLDIQVPTGSIFGMIGPSGSGKTTTVRLMTGLYKPDKGVIRVLGQEPARFTTTARERLGYMPQQFVLYPNLTVLENLNFVASLYGLSYRRRRGRIREVLEFVELDKATRRLASQLSGGMKRRLELACSLIHDPALLFADEPTAGIDPVLRGKFWEHFRNLRDQGHTLFVTTQYVGEAAYCDLVGVMRDGRIVAIDTPEGLRRRALDGEIVQLITDPARIRETFNIVHASPLVKSVERSRANPAQLRLHVDSAGEALPVIVNLFDDHPELLKQIEPYVMPFDDVFIALMQQSEHADAA